MRYEKEEIRSMEQDNRRRKEEFQERLIKFTLAILKFSDKYASNRTLSPIFRQLVRSGSSIGANVVEAQGSASKKEFRNFFHIALKSAKETRYWLIVLSRYSDSIGADADGLLKEVREHISILSSSILTMKSRA